MSRTNENAAAPMSGIVLEVWTERVRQVQVEGYTPESDDCWNEGELATAAFAYLHSARTTDPQADAWPWEPSTFKPTTPRANLIKACALLVAEIERLDRAAQVAA